MIAIGAFHALLEVSGHRSLFFPAKLSSTGSAVVPTAILSDRGHTHASRISISLSLLDIYEMDSGGVLTTGDFSGFRNVSGSF